MTAPVFEGAAEEQRDLFAPAQVAQLVAYLGRHSSAAVTAQVFVAYANLIHLLEAPRVAHTFQAMTTAWDADQIGEALGGYFTGPTASPGFAAQRVLDLAAGLWRRPPARDGS
jgi:hypothetical protein